MRKIISIPVFILLILYGCRERQQKTENSLYNVQQLIDSVSGFVIPIEDPDKIAGRMRSINMLEYGAIGIAGRMGDNYKNYLGLRMNADTTTLLRLTKDTNAVVACYATWALIDKSYPNIESVLRYFLNDYRTVTSFSGCLINDDVVASEIYRCYWNRVPDSLKATDRILFAIDTIVLYNDTTLESTYHALKNRDYSPDFHERIRRLKFGK
jgi:hypothetical protein